MDNLENVMLELISHDQQNGFSEHFVNYELDSDSYDEIVIDINNIEIGFGTKNVRAKTTYEDFVNEFKKLQAEKLTNTVKQIVDISDITNVPTDLFGLEYIKPTYNNILHNIKTYYICLLTKTNIKYFQDFIDYCNKKKFKPKNNYALIFNSNNIFEVNLKNKIETIIRELEEKIKLNCTPADIIDSDEFIQEIKSYATNNNSQVNDLTEQITNISINSKVDMIERFITCTKTEINNDYLFYEKDLYDVIDNLDKKKIYVCNTTLNTFYFISLIFNIFDFPYNYIDEPMQNGILILSPRGNLYLYNINNFSGINKTRINVLFEKIFNKNAIEECCICYKKTKKNNICYNCFQFNGCVQCGKKLVKCDTVNCVLCKA